MFKSRKTDVGNSFVHIRHGLTPFWGTNYYIDQVTGIVLTEQCYIFRGGHGLDFRALTQTVDLNNQEISGWECEFFCEPESVLSALDNGEWKSIYASYLNTKKDVFYDSSKLIYSTYWSPGMGMVPLPSVFSTNGVQELPISWNEITTFVSGNRIVANETIIGLPVQNETTFVYVYQDAAYLWFPRHTQVDVIPFTGSVVNSGSIFEIYGYHAVEKKHDDNIAIFAGNVDLDNGVLTAIVTNHPGASVGNIGWYLGFHKQEMINGFSYSIFDSTTHPLKPESIPEAGVLQGVDISSNDLRNIFMAFSGNLSSGESISFRWARIMIHHKSGFLNKNEASLFLRAALRQYLKLWSIF